MHTAVMTAKPWRQGPDATVSQADHSTAFASAIW